MIDLCLEWVLENYPSLFLFTISGVVLIYTTMKAIQWNNRIKAVEKECEKVSGIDTQLISIQRSLNGLIIYLKGRDQNMDTALFRSNSPVELTEIGEKILIESGGRDFIDSNSDELVKKMEDYGVNNALDAQNIAPIVIESYDSKPEFIKIKDYVYNHPRFFVDEEKTKSISLDLNAILTVLGIYLRNKFLQKHSEIDPER